jgi:hypothetical protein
MHYIAALVILVGVGVNLGDFGNFEVNLKSIIKLL